MPTVAPRELEGTTKSSRRKAGDEEGEEGAERKKDEDGQKKGSARKRGKKNPGPPPAHFQPAIRLSHHSILTPFSTMTRRFLHAPATCEPASRWARIIICNGPLRMRCTALVLDEPAPHVLRHPGSTGACALLSAHLASWLVSHSAANVPHSPVLDKLLADTDRHVELQGSHLDTHHILYIVAQVVPMVKIVAQIRTFLPPAPNSPDYSTFSPPAPCHVSKKTFTGGFDAMWHNVIGRIPNATYIVHWNNLFFVLRIDNNHKFWVIDTSSYARDPSRDRALIVNLGVCTSFSDSRDPDAPPRKELDGADACKVYFKEFRAGRAIEERFDFDFKHNKWADLSPSDLLQAIHDTTTTEEALRLRKITFYHICAISASGDIFLDRLSAVVS